MITYATLTSVGSREINEDSLEVREEKGRWGFALADGLGGHGKGEVASLLAVQQGIKVLMKDGDPAETLSNAMLCAQEALLFTQQSLGAFHEMKTTLVLLTIAGNQARWAHVGDSRLYLFERDRVVARTLDHSVPQMLVAQGEIRERDIRTHEDRNRLLRVLGTRWDKPKMEISSPAVLGVGSTLLLCSDGFWELIEEKEMGKLLKKSTTPEKWLSLMEEVVQKNGSGKNMDNYSAIAIFSR